MDRQKTIIKASIIGIFVNLSLVVIKVLGGFLSNSIAMILDAVNSFSDALSQIITIVGTKLSGKAPDKKHPYGYGRIEYITSVITALIVLMAGLSSAKESIQKIIDPEETVYGTLTVCIIIVAIVTKFVYGLIMKRTGEQIQADSLKAMGTDAFMDSVLSATTLIAAIIKLMFNLSLEGIVGAVISVFIIKAGFEMVIETLNSLIGVRADEDLTKEIKSFVRNYPGVNGAYDLVLHNYGPSHIMGSVHVEIPDEATARDIHHITRQIQIGVYEKFGIVLTVGIYAENNTESLAAEMRKKLLETVKDYEYVLQAHGFYLDEERKDATFDVVMNFKEKNQLGVKSEIEKRMEKEFPGYHFSGSIDKDYSD